MQAAVSVLGVTGGVEWSTIASLATAGGTLILALATFASVRSANRSARLAEEALQERRLPVLVPSRLEDPEQKIMFADGRWVHVPGGRAAIELDNGVVYFAASLRNVGFGMGVLQGWLARAGLQRTNVEHAPEERFRAQTRDLYIPAGDVGLWQGALRDPDQPGHADVVEAVQARATITVELLYSDQVGGQRTITRFSLVPAGDDGWLANVTRHWYLDRVGPR